MSLIFIKSLFEAECRRFSIVTLDYQTFEQFYGFLERMHKLQNIQFVISYVDPKDDDILPINNDDNHARALLTAKPLLRIIIRRKDDSTEELALLRPKNNFITSILGRNSSKSKHHPSISNPQDFRQVSAIIDVDVVPESWRRVRLLKHGTDKPLGFYIRDGISVKVTQGGLEKIPSIFISRLVPGGLAESTGLLAVDDEVIEVNGIEVANKTLDQLMYSHRVHTLRVHGGNKKYRALRLDSGTFCWGSEGISRKTRIIDIVYNASNNELVRTKNNSQECDRCNRCHTFSTVNESPQTEEQFRSSRLLACISSRPGQCGRADGYVLEGKEFDFYHKKLKAKKSK